ncbi:hypothetical protein G5714_007762 [Onychostoma macrolepis]|uniref:Uncharacterized protein n=1 Tax=Onychostoma macrolepis TaxID=369639 RepID=A0A7J6CUC6_9TELE|nr:hypothetical protein G5714_007762 [Onychostoma macrolepis]
MAQSRGQMMVELTLKRKYPKTESVTQWNKQDEGRVTRADDSEDEDDDERDATYVPEDEADSDEDGDVNSGQIVCQDQPAASEQTEEGIKRVFQTQLDFLMKKVTLEYLKQLRPGDKGIEREKSSDINSKLCPMMPLNRRQFWENLAEEE